MSENKTRPSDASVQDFLDAIPDADRRADARTLVNLMQEVTGEAPTMWGGSMIGFGTFRYRYASGREGDWFVTGFAPRKGKFSIYAMTSLDGHQDLLAALGRHTRGKGCLYVRRLDDIDLEVLRALLTRTVDEVRRTHAP